MHALVLHLAAYVYVEGGNSPSLRLSRQLSAVEECGTKTYEVAPLVNLYKEGKGTPDVPIVLGTSENMQVGLPFDFTGIWWMMDNPVPEELLSFAGMSCTEWVDAPAACSAKLRCSISNSAKHMWSWDDSFAASVIQNYYAFTSSSNSEMIINFCNNTSGDIQTSLTDVPLIWVDRWPIQKLDDDRWLRPTIFQEASPLPDTNYTLTRIVQANGQPTSYFAEFVEWMESRNRKLVVFDSDSDCKRRCMMHWLTTCTICRWWC